MIIHMRGQKWVFLYGVLIFYAVFYDIKKQLLWEAEFKNDTYLLKDSQQE